MIWDAGHDPESQNLVDIVGGRFLLIVGLRDSYILLTIHKAD